MKNSARLLPHKPVDDKEQVPTPSYSRHTRWGGKEEGVYEAESEMRLQQCQNQGGRQMEGSVHNAHQSIQTHSYVFWVDKLLCHVPNMMNNLFWDLINQGDTITFINDILVATDTEEGHDELVKEVLRRLEENDLFVKPEKCKQKVREVEFLGVVIGPRGVEMQKEKVEGVLNWPVPRNVKEVQKFLGLANYYRRFIKDFAKIAALLHVLVRKEQKWKQKKEQEKAFRKFKEMFTTELVLAIPDIDREMKVEADASDYATGGVLLTKCKDGKWRLVAFISKL